MAKLPLQEVQEIALLARIHLSPQELGDMQTELGAILEHFGSIAAIDTEGVAPMTHAVPIDLPLRADVAEPSLSPEAALAAVPKRDGDLIVVPAIIPGGAE